ncbi:MAG: PQQ-like beta-propeller repeat protein [Candidatus Hydrogenedentes bacterium]|nr:PQQ-like beta-propeller repeat protein [Candidatus Hydrogenedentota bacterium]
MSEVNESEPHPALIRTRVPVILLILQFVSMYIALRFGSTIVHNVIGMGIIPGIVTIIILIWWLRVRQVPLLERFLGLALFVVAQWVIALMQPFHGEFMLAYSIPAMTTVVVAALSSGTWLSTRGRRIQCVAAILLCVAAFAALRIESVGGGLSPVVVSRWSPSAAERSAALESLAANKRADLPAEVGAQDWPAFRGPHRDNHVAGLRFATDWSTPPRVRWQRPVGPALSSFAVVGNYLFTQEQRGAEEVVSCYDARTGEPVWNNAVTAQFEDSMGLGPRATPAYDRGKLFAIGATGIFQCLDAATGETIWKHELGGGDVPMYGYASSPLVVGDRVLAYSCGAGRKGLFAFDIANGAEAWFTAEGTNAYSSPQLTEIAGTMQILLMNNTGLQSFAPETGALMWAHDWPYTRYPRCVQPMAVTPDSFALGTTGDMGTRLVRVSHENGAWSTAEVWTSKKLRPYFNDGVALDGSIYGFDGNRLNCVDGATGERRWQGERYGGQIMLIEDMKLLLVLSEAGEIVLVEARPDAATEVARMAVLEGKTWNHPVVAQGAVFVRNAESMACVELPDVETGP